jgi:hypothetical protein
MLQEWKCEEMKGICILKNKYINTPHQIIIVGSEDKLLLQTFKCGTIVSSDRYGIQRRRQD